MKIRLLKRLRKEAYEIYGITEIINDFGRCEYIVGKRKYLEDYRKYTGSYVHFAFRTDAVKKSRYTQKKLYRRTSKSTKTRRARKRGNAS